MIYLCYRNSKSQLFITASVTDLILTMAHAFCISFFFGFHLQRHSMNRNAATWWVYFPPVNVSIQRQHVISGPDVNPKPWTLNICTNVSGLVCSLTNFLHLYISLWTLTRQGNIYIIHQMMQYGADLRVIDLQGKSSLHHAVTGGNMWVFINVNITQVFHVNRSTKAYCTIWLSVLQCTIYGRQECSGSQMLTCTRWRHFTWRPLLATQRWSVICLKKG